MARMVTPPLFVVAGEVPRSAVAVVRKMLNKYAGAMGSFASV